MRVRAWSAAALAVLPAVLAPAIADAQPRVYPPGLYVTPSLSVAEVYDDNLFATPSQRQKDFISRFSPGIEAGYRSAPLTILGRYTFDAEVYADHSELNDAMARQEAVLEVISRPSSLLTLSLEGAFFDTNVPSELNVATGLATGRVETMRLSANPSVEYRFDPLTEGVADYTYTIDEQEGGVETRAHVADLRLDRRFTPRDTGNLGYIFRHFTFDGDETDTSHTIALGWVHALTQYVTLTVRAGPRFSDDGVDPDVLASIRQRVPRGDVALSYWRSQTTVIGRIGAVGTEGVTLTATYGPLEHLRLAVAPSVLRSWTDDGEAIVYGVDVEATYRLRAWLSLSAAGAFRFQEGGIDPGTADQEILRNVVLLRLTITYPYRLY